MIRFAVKEKKTERMPSLTEGHPSLFFVVVVLINPQDNPLHGLP